ncbi:dienelactone hydrolase family protein [Sporichthya sp.]|uniref:dienelactone hydrolase family protein n=1 Tax=Sporichthya sp. TaxID=65475 RepID=UPI00182D6120|nr:dienelactone hydrolase family protein [Sporichthya sp.]MBA3745551.1 dienelactone hydrolase family protein [Sporichthya sp.]
MEITSAILDTDTPDGPMAVLHKRPADGEHPLVLMYHDGPGIRTATHVFAEKLAGAGYEVIVPDLFHRQGRLIGFEPAERAADPSLTDKLWEMIRSLTDDGIQADGHAALTAVGASEDRPIATIGFCLGARAVAVALARRSDRVVAGAMWHPSFLADETEGSPHHAAAGLNRPLFVGVGGIDTVQPMELHRPYLDIVEPIQQVEVVLFEEADHGYTWPDHASYNERAATVSFERTTAMFAKAFAG